MNTCSQITDSQAEQFRRGLFTMQLIHLTLVGGVVLFGVIVVFLIHDRMTLLPAFGEPLSIVAVITSVAAIVLSAMLRKVYFAVSALPPDLDEAMRRYQVFFIMRAAFIEGSALYSAVATLVTCNILPAGLYVLCTGMLIVNRPTQHEIVSVTHKANMAR